MKIGFNPMNYISYASEAISKAFAGNGSIGRYLPALSGKGPVVAAVATVLFAAVALTVYAYKRFTATREIPEEGGSSMEVTQNLAISLLQNSEAVSEKSLTYLNNAKDLKNMIKDNTTDNELELIKNKAQKLIWKYTKQKNELSPTSNHTFHKKIKTKINQLEELTLESLKTIRDQKKTSL